MLSVTQFRQCIPIYQASMGASRQIFGDSDGCFSGILQLTLVFSGTLMELFLRHGLEAHAMVEGAPAQMLGFAQIQQLRWCERPVCRGRSTGGVYHRIGKIGGCTAALAAEIVAIQPVFQGTAICGLLILVIESHGHQIQLPHIEQMGLIQRHLLGRLSHFAGNTGRWALSAGDG